MIALTIRSVPAAFASREPNRPHPSPAMPSEEPPPTDTPSPSPTATATPVTGLTFISGSGGCTTYPYITCSSSITSTHTDPYRWDFDITFTYNDNRTNWGATFSYQLKFNTSVYYTSVPIWWEMYPTQNEVMPNRWIDMQFSGVSDHNPMEYPTGSWTLPGQPSPYQTFWIKFSRNTGNTETLVRTDTWHLTVATYDYRALTPIPTPTGTPTDTPTDTPTNTPTSIPTFTPTFTSTATSTPNRDGSGTCWGSGASWPVYDVSYSIDSSIPESWINSIVDAAAVWTNITPSHFSFSRSQGSANFVDKGPVEKPGEWIAITYVYASTTTPITSVTTTFDENDSFDPSFSPSGSSYSVENIMVHEFGHWLYLADQGDFSCRDVTMYKYSWHGETTKITLESADIEAINWQYP